MFPDCAAKRAICLPVVYRPLSFPTAQHSVIVIKKPHETTLHSEVNNLVGFPRVCSLKIIFHVRFLIVTLSADILGSGMEKTCQGRCREVSGFRGGTANCCCASPGRYVEYRRYSSSNTSYSSVVRSATLREETTIHTTGTHSTTKKSVLRTARNTDDI